MDGRGRAFDNIFVERLWRSVKYEDVYLKGYQTMTEAEEGLKRYFQFYTNERFHQSLGYRTPRASLRGKDRMERGIHLSTLIHRKERKKNQKTSDSN
ncbi:MAG: transposase [Chlamydiae bacterium]|nr:transposase [Chlamydiota bacterium]MBI3277423.1 transposase [Chlamydiota bacterium]